MKKLPDIKTLEEFKEYCDKHACEATVFECENVIECVFYKKICKRVSSNISWEEIQRLRFLELVRVNRKAKLKKLLK